MSEFRAILTTRQTEKAYLIRAVGKEVWLPRSVLKSMTKFAPDANGEREVLVEAADWWVEREIES